MAKQGMDHWLTGRLNYIDPRKAPDERSVVGTLDATSLSRRAHSHGLVSRYPSTRTSRRPQLRQRPDLPRSARSCRDECAPQVAAQATEKATILLRMGLARTVASRLMSRGVLSAGWYSILTGLALLAVSYALGSVSGDAAAPFVAVGLAVTGLWQLERGLRAEFQRRPKSTDGPS